MHVYPHLESNKTRPNIFCSNNRNKTGKAAERDRVTRDREQ